MWWMLMFEITLSEKHFIMKRLFERHPHLKVLLTGSRAFEPHEHRKRIYSSHDLLLDIIKYFIA